MAIAVGIDLGTTNTVVAVVRDGKAATLSDEAGRRLIPSVVSFHPNQTVLVGATAVERRIIDPENTVFSVKRMIGRTWKSDEVQKSRSRFPFNLVEGAKQTTLVATRHETYALPEISAFVLRRAKAVAEAAIGQEVDSAVITVPANFDDLQRASTKMAGKLAGLNVLRILNEPTAAALAYGRGSTQSERIAIYDLGGGTFDITLLDLSTGVFEVLATAGDTALGGDDVDTLIVDKMAEHALRTMRIDPRTNMVALAKMRVAAESLKCMLSASDEATIEVDEIARGDQGMPLKLTFRYTRAELEAAVAPFVARTLDVTRSAIEAAKLTIAAFDRVILVGGSTRMPLVSRVVEELFQKKPDIRVNPDEVVALGAAIQASALGARSRLKPAPASAPDSSRGGPMSSRGAALAAPELAAALVVSSAEPKPAKKTMPHGAVPSAKSPSTSESAPPSFARAVVGAAPKAGAEADVETKSTLVSAAAAATGKPKRERKERPAFVDPRREPEDDDSPPKEEILSEARVAAALPREAASVRRVPAEPARESAPLLPRETAPMSSRKREEPETLSPPVAPAALAPSPVSAKARPPAITRADPSLEKPEQPVWSVPSAMPPAPAARKDDPRSDDQFEFSASASIPRGAPDLRWSSIPPALGVKKDDVSTARESSRPRLPKLGESFPPVFGSPSDAPEELAPVIAPAIAPALAPELPAIMAGFDFPPSGVADSLASGEALLIDVTPLSLRVETVGGYSDVLIAANSPVPCDRTRVFSTASDNQTQVFIRVAQGEVTAFAKNTFLGELELSGLSPVPRGEAQIAVTFEIDADGIINVRAKDGKTGRETTARMHVVGAQTDANEVDTMLNRQRTRTLG